MLRSAVQRKPYNWEPLLPAVIKAYRFTLSVATEFTIYRLVFYRKMRLLIDVGTPPPEPPRDIRMYANLLLEDLEWCYRVVREVTGLENRCCEARYNERVIERNRAYDAC